MPYNFQVTYEQAWASRGSSWEAIIDYLKAWFPIQRGGPGWSRERREYEIAKTKRMRKARRKQ